MCESWSLSNCIVLHLNILTRERLYATPQGGTCLHVGDHARQAVRSRTDRSALADAPREGKVIELDKWPTLVPPLFESKAECEAVLKQHVWRPRRPCHLAFTMYDYVQTPCSASSILQSSSCIRRNSTHAMRTTT
jgi:hypothetical protein